MDIEKVLVTGASGKIGRRLVPALVAAGYRVRAVEFHTPVAGKGVEVARGSVSDRAFVKRAIADVDAVIHLASAKEDRDGVIDVSMRGTFNLLDESRQSARVKQFLLAGGDCAVGIFYYPQPRPIDETHPLTAYPGYYALSKALEETMCNQHVIQYKLPVTILRISWVHDEDDLLAYMTLAEPNFGGPAWKNLAKSAEQKSYFEKGRDGVGCLRHPGGSAYKRHIVHVNDVVHAFLRALGNPRALGETFHVAAPSAFSYDALARYTAEKLKLPVVDFELDGFYDFEINITKARAALGYEPGYDVFRMVDEAMEFRRSGGKRTAGGRRG